jgi:ribonuclease BN (tRNA processing enzyme)
MQPRFPLDYLELEVGKPHQVRDLVVIPQAARHTEQTNPTALRVEVAGKAVAYTGDGEWTEDLAKIGRDADLLIAECYYYAKPVKWHLNYPALTEHLRDFGARRVILTHMGPEMLAHTAEIAEECAHDGLVVEIR